MLMMRPMMAKGILAQFSQPNSGMKAMNMPTMAKMPQMKPINCMVVSSGQSCGKLISGAAWASMADLVSNDDGRLL